MPGKMKQGQSIFIPFKNGESIYDSQNKARMYMSEEKFRASFPGWRFGEVELIEYAPKQRWISVEEKLPTRADANPYESVLAIQKDDGFARAWIWDIVVRYCGEFTHWMPLPEPPKEEV